MPIPTSIPFLEAAYAPRPRQPDTGGESFMRAFERAQDRRQDEPERLLHLKNAEQTNQLNALRLTDAIRSRDDAIAAEGSLTVFADRIRRAQVIGPSEAAGQRSVIEWVEGHRGILTLPAGKAMWTDYLNSVEDDRQHVQQIAEIKARGDVSLQTQAAMGVRQEGVEGARAAGRMTLEEFKADRREDLTKLKASLSVMESGGVVTPAKFVDRHLNTILSLMPYTADPEQIRRNVGTASSILLEDYDEKLASLQKAPAATATPVADIGADRYQTEADARADKKVSGDTIELWDAGTGRFRRARLR